ncbi:MAG: hypothetical protein CMM58_09305 [Rhodospirillaceae bacterium]|nr:hypothetical protein [Rhodospirillaceae bacterium]|tara:strand:+ start:590 stop:1753 length:1164 start_codon:yes stop_codon:yes gene_type:complete
MNGEKKILTTHAGSLPRPDSLVELYAKRGNGERIDDNNLAAESEWATRWVVEKQADIGIDIPSNGEQSREAFFLYLQRRLTGFSGRWDRPAASELNDYPEFKAYRDKALKERIAVSNFKPPIAKSAISYSNLEANMEELRLFKDAIDKHSNTFADAFITAPSPGIVAKAMKNEYYSNEEEYLDALANALVVEYRNAIDAGFILQIDAPDLALERHISFHDKPLSEFLKFIDGVIKRINWMIKGLPSDRVRLHVCYGNYESPHDRDVALEHILPHLLEARVGGFLFPFANPRHQHEIKLFRKHTLTSNQYLIVGAIDTLSTFVEHPEVVADRIEMAVECIGDAHRVMAGTDCGFDTSAGMGRLTTDVVWAKLAALKKGAEIAEKRLFC